jgi:predicted GNAT family N-acyltransferase
MNDFSVRTAEWKRDRDALRAIRTRVFIEEQKVPPALEWDGLDAESIHMLALTSAVPIGTARLTPDNRIGRMAVLADWRERGVGKALLQALMDIARRRGERFCCLNAQVSALGFYARFGFVAHGDAFMDAGIPHREMTFHFEP